jgi:hypothetical protein
MRIATAALLVVLTASAALAQPPPSLAFEASPALALARARLEAVDLRPLSAIVRAVGLANPGPPIRTVVADAQSEWARHVPVWAAGFAVGEADLIVLFPARAPGYPHDTLEDVLRHEIAHVLISRAGGGATVPRWFHEGFAVAVERPWDAEDRARLATALVFGPRLSLDGIDALFDGGEAVQARAYSLSAAVVRHLMATHGADTPGRVLREVAAGRPFVMALASVTAQPQSAFEANFWQAQRGWTTWVPLLASTTVLWTAVIGLAALARRRVKQRSHRIRARWAESDATTVQQAAPGSPASDAHLRDD